MGGCKNAIKYYLRMNTTNVENESLNFLEEIIEKDLKEGLHQSILTRFPPEPNGYLHIGHAKSICLNFGLALKYGGATNLRFDDTNPTKEDVEYVEAIKDDIRWLGFQWKEERYASDYFEQLYQWAVELIKKGLAYVDDQNQEEIRKGRGTVTQPGTNSPFRDRAVKENLELFEQMRNGKFNDGEKVLRAKIDMAHPNMLMRDPILYRIIHAHHHRTGNQWCIYPMYDYAHGQSDSIEKITHSICTLEFDIHRPLYDWFIEKLEIFPSHQYEFARLNVTHTVMSKRRLLELVQEKIVDGWDDPRMPTISGLRRKGYTPESIRFFAEKVGVARRDNLIDVSLLDWCLREQQNKTAFRRMAVLKPLLVTITNWDDSKVEELSALNNPENPDDGCRIVPLTKQVWIEQDDFMLEPPKKYFRLSPGSEVRLKYGYIICCEQVVRDNEGNVVELLCKYDPQTKSGTGGRQVKSTIHWVSVQQAKKVTVNLFEPLFTEADMGNIDPDKSYKDYINPQSKIVVEAVAEPCITDVERCQFERLGYFYRDITSTDKHLVFNRITTLKK